MLPTATVSLKMSSRRTPARANGTSTKMWKLEHRLHLELPRTRLRPGLHCPHKRPDLLFAHCKSVLLRGKLVWSVAGLHAGTTNTVLKQAVCYACVLS